MSKSYQKVIKKKLKSFEKALSKHPDGVDTADLETLAHAVGDIVDSKEYKRELNAEKENVELLLQDIYEAELEADKKEKGSV